MTFSSDCLRTYTWIHWIDVEFSQFKIISLKGNFVWAGKSDCQQAVTDEFLCIVAGCVLGTDVCHWMFKTTSTWFKVKKIPFQFFFLLKFFFVFIFFINSPLITNLTSSGLGTGEYSLHIEEWSCNRMIQLV